MDMLTFEDQDGKIYDVPVNRAHEFAQMVKKEGKIVRGRTQMDDVRDAANPWSMANLAAGAKGLVVSPTENSLKYMGENLLKGIGTAAGAVLGGAVKGIAGIFGGVAEGGARLGELVGNGIDKLNGGEGDNHTVSESISKVRKGFDEFIDLFTPNWFDPNSEIRRKHRMARGYGLGFGQLDDAQQKRIISERGLLPKDFGEKDPQEQEKIWGELKGKLSTWENRGYAREDESDVAAKDAVGGVKWLAELGGELRYGLGVVNKLAQFSSKIGQLAKLGKQVEAGVKAGTLSEETAAGLAKAAQLSASEASAGTVGSIAQKAASAAHKGVSAAFGLGRYAEMSGDENGPGGWRQEGAALVGGAINAALFTKGLPFSFGSKAASPFAKESLGEFTRRWLTRATQSGLTMAADTGAKEGIEAVATAGLRDENGNPVRWNPKTAQEVTKEILTQFAVGFGTHTIDALEESAKNTAYGRRYIAAGGQGENGEKLATRRSVEENRKIYCPMLNRQAQLVSDMHASGMPFVKGVRGTENVSGMGEDGSVMFDDHSTWRPAREWTVKGSDGKNIVITDRATITTGDGCIMDAETGEVVGVAANGTTWESRQKTVEQKYLAEGAKEPDGTADISGTTSGSPDWDANMPGDVMDYIGCVRRANDDFAAWKAAHDAWEKDPNRDEVEEPKLSLVLPDRGKLTPEGEAWLALSQMARTPDESANVARLAMQDVASGKKTLAQAYADAKKALGMDAEAETVRPETEKKTALTEVGKDAKPEVAVPTDTVAKNDTPVDGDVKGGAENTGIFLDLYEQGKLPVHEDCEIAGLYLGHGFRIKGEHAAPEKGEPVKPIIVWIGKDGERELISGDKRVMAAERAGAKTIKAVYVREIDGWTRDSARNLGNLENIRDGNGSIVDMMRAFDAMGVTSRDQLRQLGIGKNLIWANWAVDYLREAGPDLRARINNGENIPVDFIHGMTKRISMATCGDKRDQMQKIILEDVVGQLDTREGREVINVLLERVREIDLNDRRQVEDAIAEGRRRAAGESGLVADQVPVETEDGSVKTLAEVKAEAESGEGARPTETADEPESATPVADAVENAANNLGVELKPVAGNVMGCARFPEIRVQVTKDGIVVDGLTADMMTRPENLSDVAAFLTRLSAIRQDAAARGITDSEGNPPRIYIGDEDAIGVAAKIAEQVAIEGGLKEAQAKFQTRSKLFDILAKTALGNGTTFDPASFLKSIRSDPNGKSFTDPFGNVYGHVDSNGVMHFNPYVFNFNTPIHEYGHLALEAVKRINNPLWKKGMELVRKSEYYARIAEGDEYAHLRGNEEAICDEALATMIGDRGERLVISRGVDAQLKQWIKSFWRAFKGAFGIADLTEEQIEKMSLGDFVNAINAELLRGREFGTRKGIPLTKQSIQRYDEANGSGSNGVLRWKNDRGYLFAIPVDMERTQPGGKIVFARDDANITDWIQNRLNGLELRLSKSGKIYIKGRDGLDGELAEIFGRYPTIGQNDGIYGELSNSTGNQAYRDMSPGDLVEALRKDRANYDQWKQNLKSEDGRKGKSLEQSREDQHYREEEEREAFERWEHSGMSVMDYIRSRAEEGAPDFDLDWETAREIEYDRATGRFQKGGNERPYAKFSIKGNEKRRSQGTQKLLSDTAASAEVSTLIRRSVAPVLDSLTSVGSVANLPPKVKGMVDGISSVVESIASGQKVKGTGAPVSVKNLITTLRIAGFNRSADGSKSAYLMLKDRSIRISDHSADAWRFKRDSNLSVKLKMGRGEKPFNADAKKNVIEVSYGKSYLEQNPAAFAGMLRDMAEFAATGEFHDTVGAAKVEFSGETEYRNRALRTLVEDAKKRGDTETAEKLNAELPEELRVTDQVQGGKFAIGSVGAIDPGMFAFDPSKRIIPAMGDTENGAAGLAGAAERKASLRPWTSPESPAAHVKPIAFDAADLIMFARATNNRIKIGVQKGERIKGHRNAIGLNTGGTNIDIVSRLFGTIDEGDISRMREECRGEGFFRNENVDWCAMHGLDEIEAERQRSENELSRRKQDLFEHRVRTGEGGQHYAAEVLAHEIGHTIHMLAEDANLGPVGNNARTLLKAMTAEFRKKENRPGKDGSQGLRQEMDSLIAWWHGTDEAPKHYEKAEERFAEVFGIFLTQPESVHAQAPRIYETCRDLLGRNLKLKAAYEQITAAKWSGKADDMLVSELEKTWSDEAARQLQELDRETRTPTESKWDRFNYALNDRFGPMFGISNRGIKAEENRLKSAVESGAMSPEEMKDRLAAMTDEVNALKTSLYDWQRQTGGSVRLFISDINDVISRAEKDGVSWRRVRLYAHLMRVIEIGGRATAHGIDPARAAKLLDRMAEKDGAEAYAKVEKTWKAFRAVCEKHILDDPNVKELFDDMTNKMLWENKNYVTMKHRASVEEVAEWRQKIEEARKSGEWTGDVLMDAFSRLHKGLGGNGESFVLHRLEGSFKATVDPIAATLERYVALKQAATKNHLVKQLGDTLRACGVKDVFEDVKERPIDTKKYGTLSYMLKGERHYLTVPKVIADGFKQSGIDFGKVGQTIRILNAFKTVWNPLFVGITAYPQDLGAIVTNVKGLHKDPLQIIADALGTKFLGAPVYLMNNYLSRATPLANTRIGKFLWNEHTVNYYARQAQRIATICVKGNFGEMAERAAALRAQGRTGEATEIEQDVMLAREFLKKNIFHSQLKFFTQYGASAKDIISGYNLKISDGQRPESWRGMIRENLKSAGHWWEQFGEIQEAVPRIAVELYKMRTDPTMDADARARLAIEQGGTPNLSARGAWAGWVEMTFGPFWNVRKQSVMRSVDAFRDHPTEWMLKNFGQTVAPAIIKEMIVTGGVEWLINTLFDRDEEKISKSWWANPIREFARFMNVAYKCVPAYYQRNYKIIPLGTFNGQALSMKIRYSPEEHLLHSAVHTLFNKFGADPTDPNVDWTDITGDMMKEIFPNLQGRNEIVNFAVATLGPLVGINGYDDFRGRNFYDEDTFRARWNAPGHMLASMGRNAWNYSPLGTYLGKMSDPRERKEIAKDVPGWLDFMLSTPLVRAVPSSMLILTSNDSYARALKQVDEKHAATARIKAKDILFECYKRGSLGGFSEGLKDIEPVYQKMALRHILNGWKQLNQDPKLKMLKDVRSMKDPELQRMVWKAIKDGERYQD